MTKKKAAPAPEETHEHEGQELFIQADMHGHPTEGTTITASLPEAKISLHWTNPDHANVLMAKWEEVVEYFINQAHLEDGSPAVDSEPAV